MPEIGRAKHAPSNATRYSRGAPSSLPCDKCSARCACTALDQRHLTASGCKRVFRFEGRSAIHLDHWLMPLRVLYTRAGPGTCRDFLISLQTETLREHLLECPDLPTRQAFQHLLMHVVDMVRHCVEREKGFRVASYMRLFSRRRMKTV